MAIRFLKIVLGIGGLVNKALAAGAENPPVLKLPNPISCSDLNCVTAHIINGLFDIAVPLAGIMALVGGFQILTAGGDETKLKKGKDTLLYTVIGFAVILIAKGISSVIQDLLGVSS